MFHDTVQQYIAQTQSYSFLSYLPFLSVAFHFLFAAPSKPYIRYPQTNYEVSCVIAIYSVLVFMYMYILLAYLQGEGYSMCKSDHTKVLKFLSVIATLV